MTVEVRQTDCRTGYQLHRDGRLLRPVETFRRRQSAQERADEINAYKPLVIMTGARRRGFAALVKVSPPGRARISNETNADKGYVYWQIARWLIDNGLAVESSSSTDHIELTPAGLARASQDGLL